MPPALQRSPAARLTFGEQQRKQGTGSDVLLGAAPWAASLWCQVRFQDGETFHKETPAARKAVVAVCARRTDLHLHLAANGLKELALPRHAQNNKASPQHAQNKACPRHAQNKASPQHTQKNKASPRNAQNNKASPRHAQNNKVSP